MTATEIKCHSCGGGIWPTLPRYTDDLGRYVICPACKCTGAPDKAELLAALRTFVGQRPGVEAGNYGDWRSYRRELADIVKDRQDALTMLDAVERSGVTAEEMLRCLDGRLHWDAVYREIDYTTGQYFAVEYRRAVCRFAASLLSFYWGQDTRAKTLTEAKRTFRSRRIWQYFR